MDDHGVQESFLDSTGAETKVGDRAVFAHAKEKLRIGTVARIFKSEKRAGVPSNSGTLYSITMHYEDEAADLRIKEYVKTHGFDPYKNRTEGQPWATTVKNSNRVIKI